MPAKDVKTTVPAAEYKTRVGELVCRNPKKLDQKRIDLYLHFVQVGDAEKDGDPIVHGLDSKLVVSLLSKTFPVPDGKGGTIDISGAQVMEWLDLLGEEVCAANHAALVARAFPNAAPAVPTE